LKNTYDLTIIIPARNEMFVSKTVEDILLNKRGNTEVIVGLDGEWASIKDHPDVTVVHTGESIGQRAITNLCAELSKSKYLVKTDAHCAFDEGFDVKMMEAMKDNWTMVPVMRNLHAFDWVCDKCGNRTYQGPTPTSCPNCDSVSFHRDILWKAKTNPLSTSYCFDPEPHFQYFKEYKSRVKGDITPTMSLQGSFFMCTRKKYWELNLCDENFGSWGSQGLEVAIKTWCSGGEVMVNHKTWYAHMFRTQGGDFGFPYPISGRQVKAAKTHAKSFFFTKQCPLMKYPVSWLVEKFWPIPYWKEEDLKKLKEMEQNPEPSTQVEFASSSPEITKGIVYYTDNRIDNELMKKVQKSIQESNLPIVSVSLKPIDFGKNVVLDLERSYLTMFKQILKGIETIDTDYIFLCEHDVVYSKEHFDFTPPSKDLWYYNKNNWQVRESDGHAVYWECKKLSQVVASRELMLNHYRKRVEMVEKTGFSRRMGFEPGTHNRPERVDDTKSEFFETKTPNLDIRHSKNLTASRWNPSEFRNKPKNWKESNLKELI